MLNINLNESFRVNKLFIKNKQQKRRRMLNNNLNESGSE